MTRPHKPRCARSVGCPQCDRIRAYERRWWQENKGTGRCKTGAELDKLALKWLKEIGHGR